MTAQYGPGDYRPSIPITYWTFRLMIGTGVLAALAGAWLLWKMRRRREVGVSRLAVAMALSLPFLPLLANTFAWLFTEMGRQPWIVFGLMPTVAGVSPLMSGTTVLISVVGFTVLYGVLALIEAGLLTRRISAGLPDPAPTDSGDEPDRPTTFAY